MMDKDEIINALIESTMLGFEGHGCMTCNLMLNYGGSVQGFGGYGFDDPIKDPSGKFLRREGCAWGMEFVISILRTVGVERWEDLKGKHIRVRRGPGWGGRVLAIGHIVEDKWFDPERDLAHLKPQ